MNRWRPAGWPLRIRVTLAFLAATVVALAGFGVFVHVRLSVALEDRLRDTIAVEADRLAALPDAQRREAVEELGGDVHAQVLTAQGDVRASSRLVTDPALGAATPGASGEIWSAPGWREARVTVLDDDAAAAGTESREQEHLVLLVRPTANGILVVGASREDVDEALAALRRQLLIAGPLALAAAGALGYLVAGAGLRPIERMRRHAATISARTAGERLPVPLADDELRRLALTLNAMLEQLDDGLKRERRFVAEASHDLRTPLALMLTEVELALASPRTPAELTDALGSLHEEVRRLIALTEQLLDRASATEPGTAIESDTVDLVALATRVVDRFLAAADGRALQVRADRAVQIQGDARRLDRVLSNLLDNALRHGAGDIVVEIRATRDGAVVTVTDEGTGFAADDASEPVGLGLGLSIVREIAEAHGGGVEIRSVEHHTQVRVELASPYGAGKHA